MQCTPTRLYSLAAPLTLLPLMEFSISQTGDFLRGTEFRSLISELVIQLLSGFAEAIIYLLSQAAFGLLGTG